MNKTVALLKYRESITILGVIALVLGVSTLNSAFLNPENLVRVLNSAVILVLLAIGVAPIIITRNIDVSVGAILVLSGIFGGELLSEGYSALIAVSVVLSVAAFLGMVNGIIVTYGHVPSIVATLGTMGAYRGISFLFTGGYSIENIPSNYSKLASTQLLGVPVLAIAAVLAVVALGLFMSRTSVGRHIYATGDNAEGARLIGVRTNAMVITAFAISGLMSGMAALVFIAQVGSISNQAGQGMEMRAIAAAVIGGISLSGGVGSVWGAFFGSLFITAATSAMSFMGVPGFWSDTVIGALLLIALFADAKVRAALDLRRIADKYRAYNVEESSVNASEGKVHGPESEIVDTAEERQGV